MSESSGSAASNGSNGAARPKKPETGRRTFTEDFKRALVARIKKGEAVAAVAAEVGIVHSVVRRWMNDYKVKPPSGRRNTYSEKFMRDAVKRLNGGEPQSAICKDLKIHNGQLYKWRQNFAAETGVKAAVPAFKRKYKKRGTVEAPDTSVIPGAVLSFCVRQLKGVEVDMYALLRSGKIKQFEEYHMNTLAVLRRLETLE